jgi:short-subunit dehydrogenase
VLPVPHLVPYSASKAALRNLANGFRTEYADEGIQFTTVCAGLMATGGQVHTIYRGDHQQEFRWFTEIDNLPFLAATAEQAAREIVRAIKRGDPENYVTVNAKIMARLAGLFPNWTIRLSTAFNRLLPHHGGGATERRYGYEIPFPQTPLLEAAEENAHDKNQYVAVREETLAAPHGP